jgi:heptosyltransferase I
VQATDLRSHDFQRILLIKLSALGDIVHTLPIVDKLRRRYPKARIDWLVASDLADMIRGHPAIDNVIEFARGDWSTPWRVEPYLGTARVIATLRAAEYDLVLDLQGQMRSAVFAFTSGASVRIGFDKPQAGAWKTLSRPVPDDARKHAWQGAREGSWLAYTDHIALPTLDMHPVDRYLGVAPMLGLDDGPPDFSFSMPPEATARIDALLDYYDVGKAKPLAVVAPGTNWDTKEWRKEGFAEVARHLMQKGLAVSLIGSQAERALCEDAAKLAPGAINLAGETTLPELAALIRRAALCVSNDSGPMHLAVALGRPVVSIFGPTDTIWAGPYRRDGAVLRAGVPCSPCYLRRLSECPNDHACMREVAAKTVIERVEAIIAKLPARPKISAPPSAR